MEFFIIFDDKDFCKRYRLPIKDKTITVKELIDRCRRFDKDFIFDLSEYNTFLCDNSNIFSIKKAEIIKDLSKTVCSFETENFDLILSKNKELYQNLDQNKNIIDGSLIIKKELLTQIKDLYKKKDYLKAWTSLIAIQNLYGESHDIILFQIKIRIKTKRYRDALIIIESTDRINPEINLLYAKVLLKMGRYSEALAEYKKISNICQNDSKYLSSINYHITKAKFTILKDSIKDYMIGATQMKDLPNEYFAFLSESYRLLQNLVSNEPMNLKVSLLYANILFWLGKFPESIQILMTCLTTSPFNKKCYKLMGQLIRTKEQSKLLNSHICDKLDDIYYTFHIGYTLNKYGSCDIAEHYFDKAIKLLRNDYSAIFGWFVNKLRINTNFTDIYSHICPYLINISCEDDLIGKSIKNIDFSTEISKSDYITVQKEPVPIVPGNEIPQYTLNDYCKLQILVHTASYSFSGGFINLTKSIVDSLLPLIQPFNFADTIFNEYGKCFSIISSLVESIKPNIKKEKIYTIGDSNIFPLAWRNICVCDDEFTLVPCYIHDITIKNIRNKKLTDTKYHLKKILKMLPKKSKILFVFNYIETRDRCKLKNTGLYYDQISDAFVDDVNEFANFVQSISETFCSFQIFIHPLIPTGFDQIPHFFNSMISKKLLEIGLANVHVLTFYSKLFNLEEQSRKLLDEYKFGEFYLSPNYIDLLEESINISLTSNPSQ